VYKYASPWGRKAQGLHTFPYPGSVSSVTAANPKVGIGIVQPELSGNPLHTVPFLYASMQPVARQTAMTRHGWLPCRLLSSLLTPR
jgi:hypothetical protein